MSPAKDLLSVLRVNGDIRTWRGDQSVVLLGMVLNRYLYHSTNLQFTNLSNQSTESADGAVA